MIPLAHYVLTVASSSSISDQQQHITQQLVVQPSLVADQRCAHTAMCSLAIISHHSNTSSGISSKSSHQQTIMSDEQDAKVTKYTSGCYHIMCLVISRTCYIKEWLTSPTPSRTSVCVQGWQQCSVCSVILYGWVIRDEVPPPRLCLLGVYVLPYRSCDLLPGIFQCFPVSSNKAWLVIVR